MQVISGYWHIKPESQADFIEACKWIAPLSRQEEGYLSYLFTADQLNANHFLFFEEWRDEAAIEFHVAQWYFQEFMQKVEPMLAEPPMIKIYAINSVKQL
ncbi:MAG: antibiotic biosynthesis monooxygenase [Microscillaceae bacterium]|jgi:quinol monooxygenase YgiN|nr:antibiotic biosynthesis monooxygenase [Microscillaceae bacterium]